MTGPVEQFPYVPRDPSLGKASLAPMLPLTLIGRQSLASAGLVDSGAAINVPPLTLGVQLGFDWNRQTNVVELSGNLAAVEILRRTSGSGELPEEGLHELADELFRMYDAEEGPRADR